MKNRLTKRELAELHGGTMNTTAADAVNLNSADTCRCFYLNAPTATENTNTTEQCVCYCISSNLMSKAK